ncbi:MAG: AAA family ATPase, partial [Brevinematales bacterium]|nr:AAA family ATPase [Brevinematales bacterium]
MIRKIKLNNFGKFKEKEFELSDITVFYGKNESGKTTIFDGLMIKLTDVKGNDTLGKKLRRYGNVNRKENIVIEPDNKEKIPAEIFANILAIRAGEITLNLANKEFSKEISNKIMASEVNLSLLKSKIDKKANVNNNNYLLNKDKNELYDELKKLNSEINNNINKIKENEILELELKKLSFLLLDKTKKYEEKKVRFSNIENEIKILNKAQELRNITDNLRKIIEYENIEKDIENNKDIEDREVENYSSVEKEILAIEKEIELKKKQLEELRKEFDILEERKKSLSASRLSLNDIEEANIEIKKAEQNLKKNPFYLIFASIVIVLAITFTIFFKNPVLLTLLTLTFIPIFLLIQNKNNIKLSLQKFLTLFPELKDKDFTEIFKIL